MMLPLPCAQHPPASKLAGVVATDHQVVERGADIRKRHVLGRAGLRLARHVAQKVHPPEFAIHRGEHTVDMVGVGHVAGDRQRLAAELDGCCARSPQCRPRCGPAARGLRPPRPARAPWRGPCLAHFRSRQRCGRSDQTSLSLDQRVPQVCRKEVLKRSYKKMHAEHADYDRGSGSASGLRRTICVLCVHLLVSALGAFLLCRCGDRSREARHLLFGVVVVHGRAHETGQLARLGIEQRWTGS